MSTVTSPITAWVLNLDADDELAHPGTHTPSASACRSVANFTPLLLPQLGPGAVVITEAQSLPQSLRGVPGLAWCPTPWALRLLAHVGATPPVAVPSVAVLRRVNHRRFCSELGQFLPEAVYAVDAAAIAHHVSAPGPTGSWVLKRPFGYTGRGRWLHTAGPVPPSEHAWITATLRTWGGMQVEPWVQRQGDFALHGYISENGSSVYGVPTVQTCDARGCWVRSEPAATGDLSPSELALLEHCADETASALAAAGYTGPFGIDGFRWIDRDGAAHFHPRCEINARYSMGWFVGMHGRSPR